MLSKRFKFILKSFLNKAASASLVALLLLCGTVSKLEMIRIQADTNVQINPFVWLCSYFGINIYTDAQEINDAFYTAIQDAYNVWLLTQQPQQRMSIDDIIGSISWDDQQPKMLKITGAAFNALKSFANYLDSKITTASEALELTTFETEGEGSYFVPAVNQNVYAALINGYYEGYRITELNTEVREIIVKDGNYYRLYAVSLNSFKGFPWSNSNPNPNYNGVPGTSASSSSDSGVTFYYKTNNNSFSNAQLKNDFNIPIVDRISSTTAIATAYRYTFGSNIIPGDPTLNDIYALPDQAVLDDLIGAADPETDVTIDIEDSDLPWSTAATLQDILDAINSLTDTYVLDNSWPETIGKTIAQSIAIDNEITDVDYPDAITWQVPDLIGTPVITPLLEPECPTLSACLVAGIEDVGATMNSIIESNSNVSNYVSASLFLGLSLMILGAFI